MEKYIGTFKDGFRAVVWSTDLNMARFHLKDWERLHGRLVSVERPSRRAAA